MNVHITSLHNMCTHTWFLNACTVARLTCNADPLAHHDRHHTHAVRPGTAVWALGHMRCSKACLGFHIHVDRNFIAGVSVLAVARARHTHKFAHTVLLHEGGRGVGCEQCSPVVCMASLRLSLPLLDSRCLCKMTHVYMQGWPAATCNSNVMHRVAAAKHG
jgi:hypothetical protein